MIENYIFHQDSKDQRILQLELENQCLKKENADLKRTIQRLKESMDHNLDIYLNVMSHVKS